VSASLLKAFYSVPARLWRRPMGAQVLRPVPPLTPTDYMSPVGRRISASVVVRWRNPTALQQRHHKLSPLLARRHHHQQQPQRWESNPRPWWQPPAHRRSSSSWSPSPSSRRRRTSRCRTWRSCGSCCRRRRRGSSTRSWRSSCRPSAIYALYSTIFTWTRRTDKRLVCCCPLLRPLMSRKGLVQIWRIA